MQLFNEVLIHGNLINVFGSLTQPSLSFTQALSNAITLTPIVDFNTRENLLLVNVKSSSLKTIEIDISGVIQIKDKSQNVLTQNGTNVSFNQLQEINTVYSFIISYQNLNIKTNSLDVYSKSLERDDALIGSGDLDFNIIGKENNKSVLLFPPEGLYSGADLTVNQLITNPSEKFLQGSQDNPPSSVEAIAYDANGDILVSVMQDGRGGNVCFDGGFPKYYNGTWNNQTNFNELTMQYKLWFNSINFIMNKEKLQAENNKILFICDKAPIGDYSFDTGSNGFQTSILGICSVLGVIPTLKDITSYQSGKLDMTLQELNEYNSCVMFSTQGGGEPNITQQAAQNLVQFRNLGNGLMFITDHGNDVTGDYTDSGFYRSQNEVIRFFNARFYGNLNSSPIPIGTLRELYGDHPLYNNIGDDEIFPGIGSISKVYADYTPPKISDYLQIQNDGFEPVIVLIKDQNGNFRRELFTYGKNQIEPFKFIDTAGNTLSKTSVFNNKTKINIEFNRDAYPVMSGKIYSGFSETGLVEIGSKYDNFKVFDYNEEIFLPSGEQSYIEIVEPFAYQVSLPQSRNSVNILSNKSQDFYKVMGKDDLSDLTPFNFINKVSRKLGFSNKLSVQRQIKYLKKYIKDECYIGIPNKITTKINTPVVITYNDILQNNHGVDASFVDIVNSIGCVYTKNQTSITITPNTQAYGECRLEIKLKSEKDGIVYDSIFVVVEP